MKNLCAETTATKPDNNAFALLSILISKIYDFSCKIPHRTCLVHISRARESSSRISLRGRLRVTSKAYRSAAYIRPICASLATGVDARDLSMRPQQNLSRVCISSRCTRVYLARPKASSRRAIALISSRNLRAQPIPICASCTRGRDDAGGIRSDLLDSS